MLAAARLATVVALAGGVWGASTAAQAPTSDAAPKREPLIVRIGVDRVQIDAVVTDKKGRYVTDLTADDFEVLQDKVARPLSDVRYVVAETAPVPAKSLADGSPASAAVRPENVRRSIAFIVDALSATGVHATREALRRVVNEELREGDLVAIVRAHGRMGVLQQFTSDPRILSAAVDDLYYRPAFGSWNPYSTSNDDYCGSPGSHFQMAGPPTRFAAEMAAGALSSVNFVLQSLRDLPGRKSVVLFSEGLNLYEQTDFLGRPASPDPEIIDAVRRVTDLANRSSVVIYTVDPGGLRPGGLSAAQDWNPLRFELHRGLPYSAVDGQYPQTHSSSYRQYLSCQSMQRLDARSGLETLARQTGGLFFPDENRVAAAVGEVFEDQKGYYVLGYEPEPGTFERGKHGGPRFHQLKVRVKREGLRVRTRAGFIGLTDEDAAPAPPARQEDRLMRAMVSPFATHDVPVRLTTVFGHDARQGYLLRAMVHADAERLTFAPRETGGYDVALDLSTAVFGRNGALEHGGHHALSFHVTDAEDLDKVREHGLVLELDVPLAKAGAYQLRVGLRDGPSAHVGTASQFVSVPDLGEPRLALSGMVLGVVPQAPAPLRDSAKVRIALPESTSSAALRRFHAGAELPYASVVYHPRQAKATGHPELTAEVRVVRDGQEVHRMSLRGSSLMALPVASERRGKIKPVPGYILAGTLRLPESLAPGEYALHLVVTDQANGGPALSTAQWTSIEIVG